MADEVLVRGTAVAVLLLALCGLFVLGGADWPTETSATPSEADVDRNYDDYVGEPVQIGGIVVGTDPLVVEFSYETGVFEEETYRLAIDGDLAADVGDQVVVYGELRADRTIEIDAERSIVRQSWEYAYMYGVSLLAALFVGGRFLNHWQIRPRRLQVVPRERTLLQRWRGESDD